MSRRIALASFAGAAFGVAHLARGAVAVALGPSALAGCSFSPSQRDADRQNVLRDTVRVVMLPTLAQLADGTAATARAAAALADAPSDDAVQSARSAWRDARGAWKRAEAFLIGPSDDVGVTGGAIDGTPADGGKLDELVSADGPLDPTRVAALPANMRGFAAIEHLLLDAVAGEPEASRRLLEGPLAARRRQLAASACADLASTCRALSEAWAGPEGYGHALAEAGRDSPTFPLQRTAVDTIVTAMLAAAERALVAKLANPLGLDRDGAVSPELEEAPRSDFSLTSIEQNLVGLQQVYACRLGDQAGESLSGEVRKVAVRADETFRSAVDAALTTVRGIATPMRVLLLSDRAPLIALHEAVLNVKRSISTDVASALGASLGFGYSDTD